MWLWKRLHENKFNSDDNLPLNKGLKFHNMTITIRFGKLYPHVFLDDTLYEWNVLKMLEYDRIDISEETDVNKTSLSKEGDICHYWYFKDIGFKSIVHLAIQTSCHVHLSVNCT